MVAAYSAVDFTRERKSVRVFACCVALNDTAPRERIIRAFPFRRATITRAAPPSRSCAVYKTVRVESRERARSPVSLSSRSLGAEAGKGSGTTTCALVCMLMIRMHQNNTRTARHGPDTSRTRPFAPDGSSLCVMHVATYTHTNTQLAAQQYSSHTTSFHFTTEIIFCNIFLYYMLGGAAAAAERVWVVRLLHARDTERVVSTQCPPPMRVRFRSFSLEKLT